MIDRKNRFHGQNGLRALYRRGRTLEVDGLVLRHLGNERRRSFRLAVVVAKKVEKRAVARNRIRRRLYALFRRRLSERLGAIDLAVIVLKGSLASMPPPELEDLCQPLFAKLAKFYDRRS